MRDARDDVSNSSATALAAAYRTGALSPVEVARHILEAAQRSQTTINAFAALDPDGALSAAAESERRWRDGTALSPLDGVPVSVKDNVIARGMPCKFGSRVLQNDPPRTLDSPSVARLREAGAVIFGKTTTPDHAHKLFTDSPLFGVTRNPRNPAHTPGGSSGGAAAAVAAGIGPLALGSDGGGSIRIPAAWCGIFGIKPTFGLVPHHPRGAFAPLSHIGPMTRTVQDAVDMLTIISAPDARDWYATNLGRRMDVGLAAARPLHGLRVAYSPDLGFAELAVDAEIAQAVAAAARTFADLGATVELCDPPALQACTDAAGVLWVSFSALLMRRYPGARELFDPSLQVLASIGEAACATDLADALLTRGETGGAVDAFFGNHDVLLAPVMPMLPPRLDQIADMPDLRPLLTAWCNMTGNPAASIACGRSTAGLPIGLQVIGARNRDDVVLKACLAYERASQ